MRTVDLYGLPLTGGVEAVAAYNRGVGHLLRLERGALPAVASAVALDPTFALAHAALALLGRELCAPVDIEARLRDARLHARRSTERERSHVEAVARHVEGDSAAAGPPPRHRTPRTRCCCRWRCRRSPSPASPRSRRTPGGSSSAASRRTATTGGSPACSPSPARSRAASRRRWSCPAGRWPSRRAPGTRRTPGPMRTTRPATTPPGCPGWTPGSPAPAPASTA